MFWLLQTPGTHVVYTRTHACKTFMHMNKPKTCVLLYYSSFQKHLIKFNKYKFLNQDFSVDTEWKWKVNILI